jgi:hypothetical protein
MKYPGAGRLRAPGNRPVHILGQDNAMEQITDIPAPTQAALPESLLIGHIKAHIAKGEKARERADKNHTRSEDHFISAGQYLITLKAAYAPSKEAWELLLTTKVGLSTGRASELMQLASGQKSLQEIRDNTAKRVREFRARASSLHETCNEPDDQPEQALLRPSNFAITDDGQTIRGHHNIEEYESPSPGASQGAEALRLLHALIFSTAATRETAVRFLANGFVQGKDFEAVREAVADLYEKLSRAGQ